jgi:flavin reductase (DIM6/NTAB) family NADH-FMN oxidoreductase RutF
MLCIANVYSEDDMYYAPEKNNHGLANCPFKSCVIPRPIGWISAISAAGFHNLAPYSQFQNLGYDPAYVMISANRSERGKRKDTVVNIEETGWE